MAEPLVSVCCITYNQEKYIRSAIDSFIDQKADFPFEVIIHDDASTDKTPEIIREYAEKYPEIIRPVLQSENQKSKGRLIMPIIMRMARGEYIALCEGDDYWTDEDKLAYQVEAMRNRPEIHVSFHPASTEEADGTKNGELCNYGIDEKIYSVKEVIEGDGGFMPTVSLMFRREAIAKILDFADTYPDTPVGDYFYQILASINGGALYLPRKMAVYRVFAQGSWSEKMALDQSYYLRWLDRHVNALENIDKYLNFRFSESLRRVIRKMCVSGIGRKSLSTEKRRAVYNAYSSELFFIDKILWYSVFRTKHLYNALYGFRKFLKIFLKIS